MAYFLADSGVRVGVRFIYHSSEIVHKVSIRAIQTRYLKLLYNNVSLHFQWLWCEWERQHSVAFQAECHFNVFCRENIVEIREIIACPGIVQSSCTLQFAVKVRNIYGAAKHQMLKQMSHPCAFRRLVSCSHEIQHVHQYHCSVLAVLVNYFQSVWKSENAVVHRVNSPVYSPFWVTYSFIVALIIFISCFGRSFLSVSAFSIAATTSIPSVISPKTV